MQELPAEHARAARSSRSLGHHSLGSRHDLPQLFQQGSTHTTSLTAEIEGLSARPVDHPRCVPPGREARLRLDLVAILHGRVGARPCGWARRAAAGGGVVAKAGEPCARQLVDVDGAMLLARRLELLVGGGAEDGGVEAVDPAGVGGVARPASAGRWARVRDTREEGPPCVGPCLSSPASLFADGHAPT